MKDATRAIYLRLSVTDRCNLGCRYCRPAQAAAPTSDQPVAAEDEVLGLVDLMRQECVLSKVRLTGGEPLLWPGLPRLVRRLCQQVPEAMIGLTTNGVLLRRFAEPLHAAGLQSINVSLDTPDADTYHEVTRGGRLAMTMDGIRAARSAGIARVKINCVLLRTINGNQLADLARFAAEVGCELRFIELMPTGEAAQWYAADFLPAEEALGRLTAELEYLGPLPRSGTAARHRLAVNGRELVVGFITSISHPFCDTCDRLRMDCRGRLYPCLRSAAGIDLLGPWRAGQTELVRERIREAIHKKTLAVEPWPSRSMASLGG